MRILLALLILLPRLVGAQMTTTHGDLKLIHARATGTPEKVLIKILEPVEDQVLPGPDVKLRFQATNWKTQKNGRHFHVVLDNGTAIEDSVNENFTFSNLKPGPHVIRVFPVHPWHESVKQQNALAIVQFYVSERKGPLLMDPSKPMLIYSGPAGTHESSGRKSGQPHSGILIDWFLHNVSMGSKSGYLARISVNGTELMSMKEWRPHYVQGLKPGTHRIKLELTKNGQPVAENWSTAEHTITVR